MPDTLLEAQEKGQELLADLKASVEKPVSPPLSDAEYQELFDLTSKAPLDQIDHVINDYLAKRTEARVKAIKDNLAA